MSEFNDLLKIKKFLDGHSDLKYVTNVEVDTNTNYATCVIHEPNNEPRLVNIEYEPFLFIKDLKNKLLAKRVEIT